jgi:predicted nucleotide-binding protein (sugar kinase/HSP70/actin superfamily)
MSAPRVGIPRALLYHRHGAEWRRLLEGLGLEVVISPPTNAGILKEGLRHSFSDFCLPMKALLGHVAALAGNVDFLFVPRYVSVEPDTYLCPKFLGLPDVVRASFTRLPRLLDPMVHVKEHRGLALERFARDLSRNLDMSHGRVFRACVAARQGEEGAHNATPREGALNIAVLGRPYLVFDDYLNGRVLRTLPALGVNVVHYRPDPEAAEGVMDTLIKRVYWSLGKETVALAHAYFTDPLVDGIVHLSNATCGPDSFTGEVIKGFARGFSKPFMSVSIDEHTSDVGIQTRLEAFVDMMSVHGMGGWRA